MTREELKGIVFKTHSPLTVEEVMFGIDKYVEQKRAEAIDECIEMLEGNCFVSGTASKVLIYHFEQLKEKNK